MAHDPHIHLVRHWPKLHAQMRDGKVRYLLVDAFNKPISFLPNENTTCTRFYVVAVSKATQNIPAHEYYYERNSGRSSVAVVFS